jgi:hypothetical protein
MKRIAGTLVVLIFLAGWYLNRPFKVSVRALPELQASEEQDSGQIERSSTHQSSLLPDADSRSSITTKESKIFCELDALNTGVELGGQLKMVVLGEVATGFTAMIYSDLCPDGTFSIVRVDAFGRTTETLDCRSAKPAQVAAMGGIQGDILDAEPSAEELRVAISGDGFFVTDCGKSGFEIIRDGRLKREADGSLMAANSCRVLASNGEIFRVGPDGLDEHGCTEDRSCIAIANPDPDSDAPVDRLTFLAGHNPFESLVREPHIFNNALEDFKDLQSGPMGPRWSEIAIFERPPICD